MFRIQKSFHSLFLYSIPEVARLIYLLYPILISSFFFNFFPTIYSLFSPLISSLHSIFHHSTILTTQTMGLIMTACVLAAAAGTKAALTNPNRSDILGLNANSDYLQGIRVSYSLFLFLIRFLFFILFYSHSLLLPYFFLTIFYSFLLLLFLPLSLLFCYFAHAPYSRFFVPVILSSFLPSFSPYI